MTLWKRGCLGLAFAAALTGRASAQAPAAPAAPGAAAAPAAVDPAMPGGLLGNCIKAKEYCKEKLCKSQLGVLLNNGLAPVSLLSGGIISSCCPPALKTDLAKPADSAEGAAARIKADEAAAAARRAAVRYLGTVDCHYWPEAEDALVNALRADRNECVRMEAAFVLGRGCCCTKKTIEGLSLAVSGSVRDGNPAETSERVKQVARISLEHCLSCRTGGHPEGHVLPAPSPAEEKPSPDEEGSLKNRPKELPSPGTSDEVRSSSGNQVLTQAPALSPPTRRSANFFDFLSTKAAKRRNPVRPVSPPVVSPAVPVASTPTRGLVRVPYSTYAMNRMMPVAARPANSCWQLPVQRKKLPALQLGAYATPAEIAQALAVLREAFSPEQREAAALSLIGVNWQAHPQVIPALMKAARQDPAGMVRAACVRSLARLDVNMIPELAATPEMQKDTDPRVRHELDAALASMPSA